MRFASLVNARIDGILRALVFGGHFYQPDHLPLPGKRYVSILWALMHPLSRGSVHITSSDPLAPPAIDPNYFGNPADLHLLTRLLKFGLKMYQTKPLSNLVVDTVLPQKDIFNAAFCDEDGELKELEEYAKNRCGPVYHPLGTAAMMPKELGGVVDSKLKVYGTTNLRIVRHYSTTDSILFDSPCLVSSVIPGNRLTSLSSLW